MMAEYECDLPSSPRDEAGTTYVCGNGEVWISDGMGDATCLTGDDAGEMRMISDIEPPLRQVVCKVVVLRAVQ